MKSTLRALVIALVGLATVLPGAAMADEELHDRITAYLVAGANDKEAVVEIWMSNTNPVIGITLPFKFAVSDSLILDSIVTSSGRAKDFALIQPVFNPENQTLLVNMLWATDKTSQVPPIPVGEGLLARVHLRTPGKFPSKEFQMASVQLPPENVLMFVTKTLNPVKPDFELSKSAPPKTAPTGGKAGGASSN